MRWRNPKLSDFTNLPMPKLGIASLRGRLIFRGVFLLLMLATVALALLLLQEEKSRSHAGYSRDMQKTLAESMARLRHPAGQFALLNPSASSPLRAALHPMLLPYSAIDFNDQNKAHQAVEMSGCLIHYPQGDICVGVGSNPYVGGFIYIVGVAQTTELIGRTPGILDLSGVHRLRITLTHQGEETHWLAPYESIDDPRRLTTYGKLEGFRTQGEALDVAANPERDFRGWMWQPSQCQTGDTAGCLHTTYFSVRLPVEAFAQAAIQRKPQWPPGDLDDYTVRVVLESPLADKPTFDTNQTGGTMPFALADLKNLLQSGEELVIRKKGATEPILHLQGQAETTHESRYLRWFKKLVDTLPVDNAEAPSAFVLTDTLQNAVGDFSVELVGSPRVVDRDLSRVAARLGWVVAAMLLAISLAWALVELSFLRRMAQLTKRAAAVSFNMQEHSSQTQLNLAQRIQALSLGDFKGKDEVGILAQSLRELLQKVQADVQREQVRTKQDQEMWHAVGHEILSPLQSLMLLHPHSDDTSHRYVQRMQQAVKALYGHASPSEAIQAAHLNMDKLDLNAFLQQIAENAHYAGIANVQFHAMPDAVLGYADAFSLEDAITHILNNAQRYREENTPITIGLEVESNQSIISISNQGPTIPESLLGNIFEYGVSVDKFETQGQSATEHRGQGLFVAKTYLVKMGGNIQAENTANGVVFRLILPSVLVQ